MADLNRNELEAMRVLWERGAAKPADIQEQFGWPIDNGTLRSVLQVLVREGHVKRQKKGKAYYYRAAAKRDSLLKSFARRMAQVFAGGSSSDLIMNLVRTEKLAPEELEELRRLAEEKAQAPAGRKGGGT